MPIPTFGTPFSLSGAIAGGQYWGHLTALPNGTFAAAWFTDAGASIVSAAFNPAGTLIGSRTTHAGTAGGNFSDLSIATLADGRFVVALADTSLNAGDIRVRAFNMNGTAFLTQFTGNSSSLGGTQSSPLVAPLPDGNFVIAYANLHLAPDDINFYRFAPDNTELNGQGQSNYLNTSDDGAPGVAVLNDGRQIWVYRAVDGGVSTVRATGVSLDTFSWVTTEAVVSDAGSVPAGGSNNSIQAVQLSGGRIAMVWRDTDLEIVGRIAAVSGAAITFETGILQIAAFAERITGITALRDGGFVVGYDEAGGNNAFIRQYRADGTAVDAAQALPPGGASDDGGVSLTTLSDGRIVASYYDNAGGNFDLSAQVYDPRLEALIASASSFADTWVGTSFSDFILMGAGNDSVSGGIGQDYLYGEAGNDSLTGHGGPAADDGILDVLFGGAGNDTLNGGLGANQMFGDDGDDLLTGGIDGEYLDGGSGNDTINASDGNDTIAGRDGADSIVAGNGNDGVSAGLGNDSVLGGQGLDTLDGEGGNDTLDGGTEADLIIGRDGADSILGGDGADTINAGIDNDTVIGGLGADTIDADAGNDSVQGNDGNDTIAGRAGLDTIDGGNDDDLIVAGDDNDSLIGGAGFDRIEGNNGNDTITGGQGGDTLWGDNDGSVAGTDNDTYIFNFADMQGGIIDYIVGFGNDLAGDTDAINLAGIGAGITSISTVGADCVITINLGIAGLAQIVVLGQTAAGITDDIFFL